MCEESVSMDKQDKDKVFSARRWRWGYLALGVAAVASWLVLSGMNFWMGELNQDEGWYLYAAKQIAGGRLPYRDFAFTQAPLLPVIYSWGYGLVARFGVAGGRALSWLFAAAGMLLAVQLAKRASPRHSQRVSAALAFVLIGVNVYQTYFTTVVKTYALTSLFLTGGLLLLSHVSKQNAFRAAAGAGFLLACATATRISMGAALALGFAYLVLCQRRLRPWAWLDYALGGGIGLALTLLFFMVIGRDGFRFGVLEYHTLRDGGAWMAQAAFKIGCVSRLIQAYLPAALIAMVLAMAWWMRRIRDGQAETASPPTDPADNLPPHFHGFLWLVIAVLVVVHLSAPFPYDDYQVPIYPLFAAMLSAAGVRWWGGIESRIFTGIPPEGRSARRVMLVAGVWLMCLLHSFSSPMTQNWFVAGRDRIWWRLREQSPMAQLRDMGKWVRDLSDAEEGGVLLTQDIYLAVEAGLDVPEGLEMGPFSYYPDWTRARAKQIGVMNRDLMLELLVENTNAPIAAFSGYGLSIRSPEIEEVSREDRLAFDAALAAYYDHVESVPQFGQAGTTLHIWRIKKPDDEEPDQAQPDEEHDE